MKVLYVQTGKVPAIIDSDLELKTLQDLVHGPIEFIYPFNEPVAIICNEEGKINGQSEFNRGLKDEDYKLYEAIFDDFLVVGTVDESGEEDGDVHPLTDKQIQKYQNLFYNPEFLVNFNGELIALPMEYEKES